MQNVKLCTQNDSLNNFKLIKIGVEGETTQNTANYTLEISVPEKKSWLFKGFDLLSNPLNLKEVSYEDFRFPEKNRIYI